MIHESKNSLKVTIKNKPDKKSTMTKLISTLLICLFSKILCLGQAECVNHWSEKGSPNLNLDSILSTISFKKVDSLPCASSKNAIPFDHQLYINFYTEQTGDYFSTATCVNFAQRFYKKRNAKDYDEIKVVQFELPKETLLQIKNRYGKGYDGYRYFKINVLALYKFVIKENSIYFISSQSYHPGEKDSFLDQVCKVFVDSKIE